MKMNYTLGSIVTIDNEDYKIVPPRCLTNTCDGCSFRVMDDMPRGHCEADEKIPCAKPSRIYVKVTEQCRTREKKSFRNFIKYIINK